MRVSELAEQSGVSVATVKYYLREGLLQPGRPVSARQAVYDKSHVERIRLVRALTESGGLSLGQVRRVIRALETPVTSWHELLGCAQRALSEPTDPGPESGTERADRLIRRRRWKVRAESPVRRELEQALVRAEAGGVALDGDQLDRYAVAAHAVAEVDLATVPTTTPEEAVRQVVVGTVLVDPVLVSLRRLAQEDVSARVFTDRSRRR